MGWQETIIDLDGKAPNKDSKILAVFNDVDYKLHAAQYGMNTCISLPLKQET